MKYEKKPTTNHCQKTLVSIRRYWNNPVWKWLWSFYMELWNFTMIIRLLMATDPQWHYGTNARTQAINKQARLGKANSVTWTIKFKPDYKTDHFSSNIWSEFACGLKTLIYIHLWLQYIKIFEIWITPPCFKPI